MEKRLKSKETGEIKNMSEIKFEYEEIIHNSNEFEEYENNFDKYLKDFYLKINK